jgi:hypothetical protein
LEVKLNFFALQLYSAGNTTPPLQSGGTPWPRTLKICSIVPSFSPSVFPEYRHAVIVFQSAKKLKCANQY